MATGIKVNRKMYSHDLTFSSKADAEKRCRKLRSKGTNCVVRRSIAKRGRGYWYKTYRRKRKKRSR